MTKERDERIAEAYRARRITVGQLADGFGVTRRTVYNALDRCGVNRTGRRPGPRKATFTETEKEQIRALRVAGWSKERVADRLGTSQMRIRAFLDGEGLPARIRRYDAKDRIVTAQGYAYVLVSADDPLRAMAGRRDGYVLEHRVVMARSLGRLLRAEETVHHTDGDRLNNQIGNLQLRQGKHGKGVRMACADCGSQNLIHVDLG